MERRIFEELEVSKEYLVKFKRNKEQNFCASVCFLSLSLSLFIQKDQ